jgi:hypothetical protein
MACQRISYAKAWTTGLWDISPLRRHPRQRPDLAELLPHLPPRVPGVVAHKQLAVEGAASTRVGSEGWVAMQLM